MGGSEGWSWWSCGACSSLSDAVRLRNALGWSGGLLGSMADAKRGRADVRKA